jgi:DNA-binding IclR family transcriptional regulator
VDVAKIPKSGSFILVFLIIMASRIKRQGVLKDAANGQPLDRAIAILSALAHSARPMSVTELAEMSGVPVPTVHRMAAQLEKRTLVKRALGSKKLLVGAALVRLGIATTEAAMRSDQVHQILVALAGKIGEPCQIGVREENEVVYVDTARAARSAGLHFEQGRHAPIHCTSIGKIYLAELSEKQLNLWLANAELAKLTPATIVSRQTLKAVVRGVRENGWAASDEEFAPGVVGCAVPIRTANGRLIAGVGVSVPSARASFEEVKRYVPFLKAAAREIAAVACE